MSKRVWRDPAELAEALATQLQQHVDNCTCQHFPSESTQCYSCWADRVALEAWDNKYRLALDVPEAP